MIVEDLFAPYYFPSTTHPAIFLPVHKTVGQVSHKDMPMMWCVMLLYDNPA